MNENYKSRKPLPNDLPSWATKYSYTTQTGELIACYEKNEDGKWQDVLPIIKLKAEIEEAREQLAKIKS